MTIGKFSLHFCHQGVDYDLELNREATSDHSIVINGVSYAVMGREDRIHSACQILSSITLEALTSEDDLRYRLFHLTGKEVQIEKREDYLSISDRLTHLQQGLVKNAYKVLVEELKQYAANYIKGGGLIVEVVGIPDAKALALGSYPFEEPFSSIVGEDKIGQGVSGLGLWAILLADVLESKYGKKIQMGEKIDLVVNNILMLTYPIEKGYKKVLAAELIDKGELEGGQLLRTIADKVEPIRTRLNEKITHTKKQLAELQEERETLEKKVGNRSVTVSLDNQKEAHLQRLNLLKEMVRKLPSSIPEELLDLSLKQLLEEKKTYLGGTYIYDLLDQFLMKFDEERLMTSDLHRVEYADIMRKELLEPLGVCHQEFKALKKKEGEGAVADQTEKENPSYSNLHSEVIDPREDLEKTSLAHLLNLVRALIDPRGLIGADGKTILLSNEQLKSLFKSLSEQKNEPLLDKRMGENEQVIEMEGTIDHNQYSLWIDRDRGFGVVALCHGGEMPVSILNGFENEIQKICR